MCATLSYSLWYSFRSVNFFLSTVFLRVVSFFSPHWQGTHCNCTRRQRKWYRSFVFVMQRRLLDGFNWNAFVSEKNSLLRLMLCVLEWNDRKKNIRNQSSITLRTLKSHFWRNEHLRPLDGQFFWKYSLHFSILYYYTIILLFYTSSSNETIVICQKVLKIELLRRSRQITLPNKCLCIHYLCDTNCHWRDNVRLTYDGAITSKHS